MLAFYYDWYCYPFKMGSTATSPTYHDTPGWISATKYVLFLALCLALLAAILSKDRCIRIRRPFHVALYSSLLVIPLFYGTLGVIERSFQAEPFLTQPRVPLERIFEVGIFFVAALLLHALPRGKVDLRPLLTLIKVTLIVYLVIDLLEVGAFFFSGRFPAEGYDNSILVRFGSLLDKPNYFGIMTAMFFGFIFSSEWRYRTKVLSLVFLSVSLLLTLSFTAWAAIFAVCPTYLLVTLHRRVTHRFVLSLLLGILVGIGSFGFIWYSDAWDLLDVSQQLLDAKGESVDIHAQSLEVLETHFSVASVMGLEPSYQGASAESQYVEILLTEGPLYALLFAIAMADGLYRCARLLRDENTSAELRVVASMACCFLVAMMVAGIGLPVMTMFPLNLLAALMLGLCTSGILEEAAAPIVDA